VFNALDCTDGDYMALFALGLLYAISHNDGNIVVSLYILIDVDCIVSHVFQFSLDRSLIYLILEPCTAVV